MGATFEEIKRELVNKFADALEEEKGKLMDSVEEHKDDKKGFPLSIKARVFSTDDVDTYRVTCDLTYATGSKVEIKMEGFTQRVKEALKKVKG